MTAKILIVDDIATNIKLLEARLLKEYYIVLSATNGQDAINILENNKIDVILLDVMMPDMDGFETCKKIKSNPKTNHIPVIMLTALSEIEDRVKGLESGADEFLTKPIDDTALIARVKSLSRMKSIIDELKLRNATNIELGISTIETNDSLEKSKILIINDDNIEAKNINQILSKISEKIFILSNIKELENIINNQIPDLVIISTELIDTDPLRISVILRANPKLRDTAIILQAQEEDKIMIYKALELGINDYFFYPIDSNELIARTKIQLKKKYYQENLRNALELSLNLSIKDSLTELFNRHYFDTHIKQIINDANNSNKSTCLLICDIDYFKEVNDRYGHQMGDIVLKTIATTLKNIFRVTDLVARFGGEEFIILLENIKLDDALKVAERVREKIELIDFKVKTQYNTLKKTISIGLTEYKFGETINEFIERADKALYNAKNTGRNKVVAY